MARTSGNDFKFVESDASVTVARLIERYETLTGFTVRPASVDRLIIAWVADVITQINVNVNYSGNQNIPSRSERENLEALAELFFTQERPPAKAATVVMRFTISEAQTTSILIPAGTRITTGSTSILADEAIVFATTDDAYVPIGEEYVDAIAVCTRQGALGNGYEPGQIGRLVDIFPYYQDCTNITVSDGGADEATDDEFFELLQASLEAYSTAGAKGSYIYHAMLVSNEIGDVSAIQPSLMKAKTLTIFDGHAFVGGDSLKMSTLRVYAPGSDVTAISPADYTTNYSDGLLTITISPDGVLNGLSQIHVEIDAIMAGHVHIFVLMKDGNIASTTIKDLVLKACSENTVRPLTDFVSVRDPTIYDFNVDFTYYIATNSTQSASDIEAAVQLATEEYKLWQTAKLGRDINPSMLVSMLMQTGIKRVRVREPRFTHIPDGFDNRPPGIARVNDVRITNGGYEDE